ncbi:MAG TPA: EAL domain-containing protein [Candidatus Berkiella sp.]|nr:EAL domain-containing protein [Candidatus Berkiella sp.]
MIITVRILIPFHIFIILTAIKIDGGFVRQIEESKENQFFVRSLVDIAHSLDILVIAEAVETQSEYDMLQKLKVDGAQGYFVGKPTHIDFDK